MYDLWGMQVNNQEQGTTEGYGGPLPPAPPATPVTSVTLVTPETPPAPAARLAQAPPVPGAAWLQSAVSAAAAYGCGLGAALVAMTLLVLGFFISGTGNLNGMQDALGGAELDGLSALAIYPFFLVNLALGASASMTVSAAFYSGPVLSFGVFAVPLAITLVMAVTLHRMGRRAERKIPLGSGSRRWLLAAVTGLVLAVLSLLLSFLLALRIDSSLGSIVFTTASVQLFLGALLLGTVASWTGRKRGADQPLVPMDKLHRLLPGVRAALRVAGTHYLAYTAVAGVALLITAFIRGNAALAFAAPLWLPTATAWAYGTGHLSAVFSYGQASEGLLTAFDLPLWVALLLAVFTLLLAAASAAAWHLGRNNRPAVLSATASWLTLPVVFGLLGLAVTLLSTVALGGQGAAAAAPFGSLQAAGMGPAPWTFLILAGWGLLIEAASRYLGPLLAPRVPQRVRRYFGASAAPVSVPSPAPVMGTAPVPAAVPALTGAQPGPGLPPGPPAGPPAGPPPAPPAPPAPDVPGLSPESRKRITLVAIIGGAVLLVVVAAAGVLGYLSSAVYTPKAQVESYLSALVDGEAEAAGEMFLPTDGTPVLFSDEIYRAATNRITEYEITNVETYGTRAGVTADVTQNGRRESIEFSMVKGGTVGLFFSDWRIDQHFASWQFTVDLPAVLTGAQTVKVNGVQVQLPEPDQYGSIVLPALPGDYVLSPPESTKYLSFGEDQKVSVAAAKYARAEFSSEPTQAALDEVDALGQAYLDMCMQSTSAESGNCPNKLYLGKADDQYRSIAWTLQGTPEFEVRYSEYDGGIGISAGNLKARATYEERMTRGGEVSWEAKERSAPLYIYGEGTITPDEVTVDFGK